MSHYERLTLGLAEPPYAGLNRPGRDASVSRLLSIRLASRRLTEVLLYYKAVFSFSRFSIPEDSCLELTKHEA